MKRILLLIGLVLTAVIVSAEGTMFDRFTDAKNAEIDNSDLYAKYQCEYVKKITGYPEQYGDNYKFICSSELSAYLDYDEKTIVIGQFKKGSSTMMLLHLAYHERCHSNGIRDEAKAQQCGKELMGW